MNTTKINDMSRAGLRLAQETGRIYSDDPRVLAVMAGGSVSRGCADEYSDVEIGVFWDTPPSDADRRDAARRMGGEVWKFDPSGGDRGKRAHRSVGGDGGVEALPGDGDGVSGPYDRRLRRKNG